MAAGHASRAFHDWTDNPLVRGRMGGRGGKACDMLRASRRLVEALECGVVPGDAGSGWVERTGTGASVSVSARATHSFLHHVRPARKHRRA